MNKEWLNNIVKGYLFDLVEELKRENSYIEACVENSIENPYIILELLAKHGFFKEILNEEELERFKLKLEESQGLSAHKFGYAKSLFNTETIEYKCLKDPVEEYPKEKGINYEELLYSDKYEDRIKVARAGLFLDKLVEDRNIRVVLEALDQEFEPARYARFILSPDKKLRNIGLLTYANGLKGYSNKNILEEN